MVVRADGSLVAVPFDPDRLEVIGDPVAMLDGVSVEALGTVDFAVSDHGTLMYSAGEVALASEQLSWVTRDGGDTPIDPSWRGRFTSVALSPEGDQLAVIQLLDGVRHVWIKALSRDQGSLHKLTFEGALTRDLAWTADNTTVAFSSNRTGNFDLYSRRADGGARGGGRDHVR